MAGRRDLPLATVRRIFKEALGEKKQEIRVSDEAIQILVSFLMDTIQKIAPIAYDIAHNAQRKTIRKQDIETAIKALREHL